MQKKMQDRILKCLNLDNFYIIFLIISLTVIISSRNYLDVSYFLLITLNYIRLKIHQRRITKYHWQWYFFILI